ncbi:PA3496 family putative envelope integrity protein [Sulfuriflexus sp.]|uniref:PA3496 family putative envelope integrity protein n=1 Tax=Sulfuriflexus sp. TaxID=2015443 RepID=UPI0028CE433B|nr:hypothetical protein [Sulfuriflexus sp.]MDT8405286.1 hypothetical protein [Sulfuriflexus sp.]
MHHPADMYDEENDYAEEGFSIENPMRNKARQKKQKRTRRKLEDRLEAKRLRKLLDDFPDY